ncbi:MAG: gliding motility-associated C-terminal domain-containing protein [Sphingobacteriales bacterium]|nr:MAG: gliding motility-associated C-terminal domain-containing protein [Sphingobacteriales bacterium]
MNLKLQKVNSNILSKVFVLLCALFAFCNLSAQHDHCATALPLLIPNNGFGFGVFTGTQVDLTTATLQPGETFAPSIITAGLNKKSVWYKFTLPTTRAARISLAQPGSGIQAGNVGFAVYKTNTCLPGNTEISTKFSPIEIFGSSYHPCVDAGEYLVQVSSNLTANGPIFITLELGEPSPAPYDKPADAYLFTNTNANKTTIHDFLVQCQTIDGASENCGPAGSFKDFTKSTWHTFTTPAYFDWLSVLLTGIDNNQAENLVGYRIYQGNSRTTPMASLVQIGGCDSIKINGITPDRKVYRCGELLPNTTYSVQLLYHKDFTKTLRMALAWNGVADTKGPQPVNSLPTPNNMGILNANPVGINNTVTDSWGCNSRHSLYSCPKTMPAIGVASGGQKYTLSSFFSFTLASTTTLAITVNQTCTPAPLVRLYKQGLTSNCTDLDTANIISVFANFSPTLTCLDPGSYVLQVMGIDSTLPRSNYHFSSFSTTTSALCLQSHLGASFNLIINAKTEVATNKFSLSAPGRFDKINANGAGVMQPLQRGITYIPQPDTLGCRNTVLPDDDLCQPGTNHVITKASYRQFTVSDSFILHVPDQLSSAYSSKLFRGDANALANSQSAFDFPQKITSLQPYSGCFSGYSNGTQNACITPGTYTLVNFDNRLGHAVTSKFTILQPVTKYNSAAKAQDMGDIWQAVDPIYNIAMSAVDTFTCHDNPLTIDGIKPCNSIWSVPTTKMIYRQFYLSKPALVSIFNNFNSPYHKNFTGVYTMFAGKATDGVGQLKSMGAKWTCFTNVSSGQCEALAVGWYTVVSYGVGPSYSNPLPGNEYNIQYSDAGRENGFFIRLSDACPQPKFNRPHKASVDTMTRQPYKLDWGPQTGHTAAYPVTGKRYTLDVENFDCSQDTAFIRNYMQQCAPENVKVSFYVFELTQESYLQVGSLPYDFVVSMYNFDVRGNDSAKLKKDVAIQPCLTNNKVSEFCKLQPGIYTLVIYGSAAYSASCIQVTPNVYVDRVGTSRFDHAAKAYDFGVVIPDSTWRNGKPGEVNPLDATRAPSNDFFYCTTGAQLLDPDQAACMSKYNPNIYQAGNNIALHPDNATAPDQYTIDRRNLWYTFTVEQAGKVRVLVKNKTPNKLFQYPFAVYKSDVAGTLPFAQVVANGAVDSTLAQGLVFVARNHAGGQPYQFCNGPEEIELLIPPCSFTPTRYYIMVENRNPYGFGDVHAMNPNNQVEVSLLFDSVSARPAKFDHFSQANDLGVVNSGIKKGETDNFTCATKDLSDPLNYTYVSNCNKTLWYKFTTTVTGQIRYSAFFKNTNNQYYDHIQLFRQLRPNDSTSAGLEFMPYTANHFSNGVWAQRCISPGTYYFILPGCNALDEDVYPQIEIIPDAGDFCSAPMVTTLNGPGTRIVPVMVDCHTIGTDYGEFNPTLTCPANAPTASYKTSWYRLDITGTDTLDVTVFINENTNAGSTDIKYRMMTGSCGAMQEQSCVQDALTRNTYKCLAPGNSYYIQVFSPVAFNGQQVTGTIDLNLSAVVHADTCLPANNCIGVASFTAKFDCTADKSALFTNFSTYGSSITYDWDFGHNNQKSKAVSPSYLYPALTTAATYTVKLVITNTTAGCNKKDSSIQTITIPARPAVNLGKDTVICTNGLILPLNATSHPGATYSWYNGSTQPTFTASGVMSPWVAVTYNGCTTRDTVNIWINPIAKKQIQTRALCNVTTVVLDGNRGQSEQYRWNTGASTNSITVAQPGYYWVDLFLNGCTVRDSFLVVTADLKPLGNDTALCQRNLPFVANATVNGATAYTWQNNSTASTFTVTQPGLYWVEIGLGGCVFRDTLLVAVDSLNTTALTARICQGQAYTLPSGLVVTTPGLYRDTLRNIRGCDSLISMLTLRVDTVRNLTLTAAICTGQTYTLPSGALATQSGIYRDTVRYTNGCDSVVTALTLTVNTVARVTRNPFICQGQIFVLPSGKTVTASGTYVDTVSSAGFCDSVITTVLNVNAVRVATLTNSICAGATYTLPWGEKVSAAGVYRDTLRYSSGCDSLIQEVKLQVNAALITTTEAGICAGESYTLPWGGVLQTAGVYKDTIRYANGCDSLIQTVTLTVRSLTLTSTAASICGGETYNLPWGGTVSTSGMYSDTLRYAAGCDSVIRRVALTVRETQVDAFSVSLCSGQTYTLPSGDIVSTAGVFRDTLRYQAGCDSVYRTITVLVNTPVVLDLAVAICEGSSYTLPSGAVVTTGGVYRDTVRQAAGCDSLYRTINLRIRTAQTQRTSASICEGDSYALPWGGMATRSDTYRDTLRYTEGCDSLIQIVELTVNSVTRQRDNITLCEGNTYTLTWGPIVCSTGLYRDTLLYVSGCDSLVREVAVTVKSTATEHELIARCKGETFTLPWGPTVSESGTYRDTLRYVAGCDSIRRTYVVSFGAALTQTITPSICVGETYTLPWGAKANTAGIYRDTLRAGAGCDSLIRIINLQVRSVTTETLSATICKGSNYTLPWGTVVSSTGTYSDTLHYNSGCDSLRRTVTLRVEEATTISQSAMICSGDRYILPWGPTVSMQGIYRDTVRTSVGCDSIIRTVTLEVKQVPVLTLSKSNDVDCMLGTASLQASGANSYTWSPAASLSNAGSSNPVAFPSSTTVYSVKATATNGCTVEGNIEVKVTKSDPGKGYLVSTAFTPNGDGKNDCFNVRHWGVVKNFQMTVYNRWGEIVFQTSEVSQCWDGVYKSQREGSATFVYVITADTNCGQILRKGYVNLIR